MCVCCVYELTLCTYRQVLKNSKKKKAQVIARSAVRSKSFVDSFGPQFGRRGVLPIWVCLSAASCGCNFNVDYVSLSNCSSSLPSIAGSLGIEGVFMGLVRKKGFPLALSLLLSFFLFLIFLLHEVHTHRTPGEAV